MKKRFLSLFIALIIVALNGCGSISNPAEKPEESSNASASFDSSEENAQGGVSLDGSGGSSEDGVSPERSEADNTDSVPVNSEDGNLQEQFDSELGQKNLKVDTTAQVLTDAQKAVLQYFDHDYFDVDYEFLQRYPQIYDGAAISVSGQAKKILSSTNDSYQILLWDVKTPWDFYYRSLLTPEDYEAYLEENASHLIIVEGPQLTTRIVEGDWVSVRGRLNSIDSYEIDGTSYTLPTVTSTNTVISGTEDGAFSDSNFQFIKAVASAFFGDDIEVRMPVLGVDVDEYAGWRAIDDGMGTSPFYIVELENQSNAKFTKYRFYVNEPRIEDAKTASDFWVLCEDENISRRIEFSADFQHYFLFAYDYSLMNLTVEYYDRDFNKLWKREFSQTTNATYDYTSSAIYMVTNNNLYIIDVATGEDLYPPAYVGSKYEIRKLEEGILMFSWEQTDALMKTDTEGNVLWKLSLGEKLEVLKGIQLIGGKIILQAQIHSGDAFLVIDRESGELEVNAQHVNVPH